LETFSALITTSLLILYCVYKPLFNSIENDDPHYRNNHGKNCAVCEPCSVKYALCPKNEYLNASKSDVSGLSHNKYCFSGGAMETGYITGVAYISNCTPNDMRNERSLYFVVSEVMTIPIAKTQKRKYKQYNREENHVPVRRYGMFYKSEIKPRYQE
jgi:hypothetical protein